MRDGSYLRLVLDDQIARVAALTGLPDLLKIAVWKEVRGLLSYHRQNKLLPDPGKRSYQTDAGTKHVRGHSFVQG